MLQRIKELTKESNNIDWRLIERIVKAEESLKLDEAFSDEELARKALDVRAKFIEFFGAYSDEPIYTLDDDANAREQVDKVSNLVDGRAGTNPLLRETLNFKDIRIQTLSVAIHQDPEVIDVLRYFSRMGEVTFEILASRWLHNEGFYAGPIKAHGLGSIKHLAGENLKAAACIAGHFIQEYKVRPNLEMLSRLTDQQRIGLVEFIANYQLVGRFSKISGHKAEMIVAQHLDSKGIEFEPKQKLTVLGSPDIEVPKLGRSRLFDLVIPSKDKPTVIIECAYYNSNTGSVASKVIREIAATMKNIKSSKDESVRKIKLIGFVDGGGWVAMTGHLIKILLVLDDFVQLSTLSKINDYI